MKRVLKKLECVCLYRLAHDIALDNVEHSLETSGENNFECNKENDTQFTWDFPVNSSNLFHSSNTSLESLNMKNAVKSKLGSRKVLLQDQIKKHKAETAEMMCSLRIEDFAKIGTDCVKLDLDSIVGRKIAKKPNSPRLPANRTRLALDDLEQMIVPMVQVRLVPFNSMVELTMTKTVAYLAFYGSRFWGPTKASVWPCKACSLAFLWSMWVPGGCLPSCFTRTAHMLAMPLNRNKV